MNTPTRFRISRTLLFAAVVLMLCLIPIATSVAQDKPKGELKFLETEVSFPEDTENSGKFSGMVTVHNNGPAVEELKFRAIWLDKKTNTSKSIPLYRQTTEVISTSKPSQVLPIRIDAFSVAQFRIEIPLSEVTPTLTGYIAVEAADTTPAALKTTLKPAPKKPKAFGFLALDFGKVIWISLGAGLFVFIISLTLLLFRYKGEDKKTVWGGDVGTIKWDFKENWLATVTGVGGILGTLLGLTILPETTQILKVGEKNSEFTALSVIFLILIAVAPLVGAMATTLFPKPGRKDVTRVWIYVLAVAIVGWAAMGELLTAGIFVDELRLGKAVGGAVANLLGGLILVLGLLALAYTIKKTVDTSLELTLAQAQARDVKALIGYVEAAAEEVDKGNIHGAASNLRKDVKDKIDEYILDGLKDDLKKSSLKAIKDDVILKLEKYADTSQKDWAQKLLQVMQDKLDKIHEALTATPEEWTTVTLGGAIKELYDAVQVFPTEPAGVWDEKSIVTPLGIGDFTEIAKRAKEAPQRAQARRAVQPRPAYLP